MISKYGCPLKIDTERFQAVPPVEHSARRMNASLSQKMVKFVEHKWIWFGCRQTYDLLLENNQKKMVQLRYLMCKKIYE